MRFGVITFPGSNCDRDCYHVIEQVIKQPVEMVWHTREDIDHLDCIILPGGFSYGDYLRTGAIAKFSPVMRQVAKAAQEGKLVIGICNGFQILCEAGLLPGALKRNNHLQFRCGYINIRVENNTNPFTHLYKHHQVLTIPIAHGEGNYYVDPETLEAMKANNQIIFRYCDANGNVTSEANPNGALENIAGICNRAGNVLGMMPHPERCSEEILGSTDGRLIFASALAYWERRMHNGR